MRYRLLLPGLLTLGALGLAACGEETTQPNTVEDQPTVPQLAVDSLNNVSPAGGTLFVWDWS